jgi:hypothetical protein
MGALMGERLNVLSIRRCRLDVEAVLELWRQAEATPGVTDTADDLRRAVAESVTESAASVLVFVGVAAHPRLECSTSLAAHPCQRRAPPPHLRSWHATAELLLHLPSSLRTFAGEQRQP